MPNRTPLPRHHVLPFRVAEAPRLAEVAAEAGHRQSQNFIRSSLREVAVHLVLQAVRAHHVPPALRQVHR